MPAIKEISSMKKTNEKKKKNKLQKKRKKILITGAAGFIGSNTLKYLFHKYPEYNFIVLDVLTYAGDIHNIPEEIAKSDRFRFVYGDVRNEKLVERIVAEVDNIIHFAAETHVARSIFDDSNFFETDVLGTRNIANAVLKNKDRINVCIHVSTSEVYGTALSKKMSEDHPLNPLSPYAAAKAGADRLIYSYHKTYNLPMVTVRPFNMYGPNQHLEKLIPRFITSALLNEPFTIHGKGDSSRDFTYVEDLARAIDLILHANSEKVVGEVFNVGSGEHISVNEIADMISMYMGDIGNQMKRKFGLRSLSVGERPGQVFRHTADTSKIKKILGWKTEVDFKDGLEKTIRWYLDNEEWWRRKLWMRHVPIETEKGKTELH